MNVAMQMWNFTQKMIQVNAENLLNFLQKSMLWNLTKYTYI